MDMQTRNARKLYVIAERRTVKRGSLDGSLKPVFEYIPTTDYGASGSIRAMKGAFMRIYNPDLKNADDDFCTRHFDQFSRSMGHYKVARIEVGPGVTVHLPLKRS